MASGFAESNNAVSGVEEPWGSQCGGRDSNPGSTAVFAGAWKAAILNQARLPPLCLLMSLFLNFGSCRLYRCSVRIAMEVVRLGRTDMRVSRVGMGRGSFPATRGAP
jgi:hypothetical protein